MTDLPRWAFWLANASVIVLIYLFAQVANAAGWQISLGFGVGALYMFCLFRWHYGWWPDFNMDGEDDANSQLPRIDPDRTNYR
ncbi:MAG TPA: hypothetical protein VNQ99_12260 [Xanthobacteraceae bacterium]|nr:hypothetical protein [Xanthobacteraceae bacterium]